MKFALPLILCLAGACAKTLPLEVVRNTARELDEVLVVLLKWEGKLVQFCC